MYKITPVRVQPYVSPIITSNGGNATVTINIDENTTAVTTVTATDVDDDTLTYSISGGADATLFTIDSSTGVLTFKSAPDYESPASANENNNYEVTVKVSDGNGLDDTQTITVKVNNIDEVPPTKPGMPTTTSPTNDNTPTWSWTASTDADSGLANPAYTLVWSAQSDFSDVTSATTKTTNSTSFTNDTLTDGIWYFRVNAIDMTGNISSWSDSGSTTVDTVKPNVGSTAPFDDAANVSIDGDLKISFSENVMVGTGDITIRKSSDNSAVESIPATSDQVTVSGHTVTASPSVNLSYWTDYYITIDPSAFKDINANYFVGITDDTIWNFKTQGKTQDTISNTSTSESVTIETAVGTNITCLDTDHITSQAKSDANFTYPLGLTRFCYDTVNQTDLVTLVFVTDQKPGDVVARKYNSVTGKYFDVPNATITETTMDGKHALKLTYSIKDNGLLDLDPAVGVVEDPVGLAVRNVAIGSLGAGVGAPSTGLGGGNITAYIVAGGAGVMIFGVVIIVPLRQKVYELIRFW